MAKQRLFEVGALEPGETLIIPLERPPPYRSLIAVGESEGPPKVYWNLCRHLPVPLDAGLGFLPLDKGEDLVCLTHGARFRADDGRCVSGPCKGAALAPVEVVAENGWWVSELTEPP